MILVRRRGAGSYLKIILDNLNYIKKFMIKIINDKFLLTIPKFTFICLFSDFFLNRQQQMSYVVKAALIDNHPYIELNILIHNYMLIMGNKSVNRINLLFICPDYKFCENINPELGTQFSYNILHFKYISIKDFTYKLSEGLNVNSNTIYLFCGFKDWHSIVLNIFNESLILKNKGLMLSGGDPSKRHMVSPLLIKLNLYLLALFNLNQDVLIKNILFNINKKYLTPQFSSEIYYKSLGNENYDIAIVKMKKKI